MDVGKGELRNGPLSLIAHVLGRQRGRVPVWQMFDLHGETEKRKKKEPCGLRLTRGKKITTKSG